MIFSKVIEWFRGKLGRPSSSNKVSFADTDTAAEKIDVTFWRHYDWKPLRFSSLRQMAGTKKDIVINSRFQYLDKDKSPTLIFNVNEDLIMVSPQGVFYCFNTQLPQRYQHEPVCAHMLDYVISVGFNIYDNLQYLNFLQIRQSVVDSYTDIATSYELFSIKNQLEKIKQKEAENATQQQIISKWRNK